MRGEIKLEIDSFRDSGTVPGGFIQAVLMNDLFAAWDYADANAWAEIKNTLWYIKECVPNGAYGSREAVARWLLHRGLAGYDKRESA